MLRPWIKIARYVLAAGWLLAVSACSADERANPQRISPEECERANGKYIAGRYCVFSDSAVAEGGVPEGGPTDEDADTVGPTDASTRQDGDIPGKDSGAPEACKNTGTSELCYSGADVRTAAQLPCRAGTRTCRDGVWGTCIGEVTPKSGEMCNGEDDDCDGFTDEALAMQRCTVEDSSVKGVCSDGFMVCRDGKLDCIQVNFPGTDACNGKDDDCDGNLDEHTELKCYLGSSGCTSNSTGYACTGVCESGIKACENGAYSEMCTGSVIPSAETCTDSGGQIKDENCDGTSDENCSCQNGASYSCYTGSPPNSQGMGPCQAGTRACSSGTLGPCTGQVTPVDETCANEGRDDDCNGTPDDVPMRNTSCADMSGGQGQCKGLATWQCSDGNLVCSDAAMSGEVCNDKDDDCDGNVDEGINKQTDNSNCGTCGTSCGTGRCCAGSCVNLQTSTLNCGACGTVCAPNFGCCTGSCKNLVNDSSNCGTCGHRCVLGCSNRNCVLL